MGMYDLPLSAAKGCLAFTADMIKIESEKQQIPQGMPSERFKGFTDDLQSFHDFMKISVNSKFEVIIIPERHRRMYDALRRIITMIVLFGL